MHRIPLGLSRLENRLAIQISAFVIAIVVALTAFFTLSMRALVAENVRAQHAELSDIFADAMASPLAMGFGGSVQKVLDQFAERSGPAFDHAFAVDAFGAVKAATNGIAAVPEDINPLVDAVLRDGTAHVATDRLLRIDPAMKSETEIAGVVVSLWSRDVALAGADRTLWIGIATGLGLVLLVALGARAILARVLARPIDRLGATLESLGAQRYADPVPLVGRGDQVGDIARRLDTLRDRLATAQAETQAEKVAQERRATLFAELGALMLELSEGRFDRRLEADAWADLGDGARRLCDDYNRHAENLQDLVLSMLKSATAVEKSSRDMARMSATISGRVELQAATLEQSAAALDELSHSVEATASNAASADAEVGAARQSAEAGGRIMAKATDAMSSITRSSTEIQRIIAVIDDIAFQTNLLALNAGVEAARAGESGKGFAVVASEVRGFAQRSADAASDIKALILQSVEQVRLGDRLIAETNEALAAIVARVGDAAVRVSGIAAASREQAGGVREINTGVGELDKATQGNAALASQSHEISDRMRRESEGLARMLSRFAVAEETMPARVA